MSIADKLTTIAENMQGVYNKGFADGKAEGGGDNGFYDAFWDAFQDNGAKTGYAYAFRFEGWNDVTFKPKYKMYPTNAYYMFYGAGIAECELSQYVDFSNCTSMGGCFAQCKQLKRLPVLNLTNISGQLSSTFAAMSQLESIEKIIVDFDSGIVFQVNTFNSDNKLKEIRFEGSIKKDIYIQYSPLSVDSMKDIISHLENHKGTDNEGLYTVKFSSSCWNTLEASGVAPDGGTWKDYVYSLGWLI